MAETFQIPQVEALLDEAVAASGLSDFGDPDFRAGLAMFRDGVMQEVRPAEAAGQRLLALIRQRLVSRLEVVKWLADHPETADSVVGPSVSITGLPRTGTTALTNIMSLDDQFRPLRNWEQPRPCPPPVLAEEMTDPRRLEALAALERIRRDQPEFAAMHLSDVDATEEDVELLGLGFHAQQAVLPMPTYHAWWRQVDMMPSFAFHRGVIQMLQSRRGPNNWLFKAPAHNFHLGALVATYPDIKVIMTHRDPGKVVPSTISILCALQAPGQKFDPAEIGRQQCEHLRIGAERAIAARAKLGEERFFDVHHRESVADPFGTLERVYAFLGRELRPETRVRMEAWHKRNRSGAHGSHRYTAEQFGLTIDQIRRDYDFYIKRYDVPLEQ